MEAIFAILLLGVIVLVSFLGGAVCGIADCKRVFGIPKGVKSLEEWNAKASSYNVGETFYGNNEP